jgi:hypothetical protein
MNVLIDAGKLKELVDAGDALYERAKLTYYEPYKSPVLRAWRASSRPQTWSEVPEPVLLEVTVLPDGWPDLESLGYEQDEHDCEAGL